MPDSGTSHDSFSQPDPGSPACSPDSLPTFCRTPSPASCAASLCCPGTAAISSTATVIITVSRKIRFIVIVCFSILQLLPLYILLYFKYQFIKHLASSQNVRCPIFCPIMLIFTSPNIFSIQYLIHSQHIAIHLKCIVTIWELPYFRNGRKMQDSLPLWQGSGDRSAPGCTSRRGRPAPGLPQRQENVGFAAVVARAEEQGAEDWDAAKG